MLAVVLYTYSIALKILNFAKFIILLFRFIKVAVGAFNGYALEFYCNGILISEYFVLSVAHCIKPGQIENEYTRPVVRLGSVSTEFIQKIIGVELTLLIRRILSTKSTKFSIFTYNCLNMNVLLFLI